MRLIDADELINQGYEIVVDGWQYDTCNKSIDIDDIPTAYDIDKVVKELGKIKGMACDGKNCSECEYTEYCFDGEQSEKVAIDKAIEIVKEGGAK